MASAAKKHAAKVKNHKRKLGKLKHSTKAHNRCEICGRSSGYIRRFRMCRICFREHAAQGLLPGVYKASW